MSGWRMNRRRVDWRLAAVLGLLPLALPATAAEDEQPSMELLEFLGDWQTQDGEWIDPITLLAEMESEGQQAQQTRETQQTQTEDKGHD
jgi:endonuclease/exonuclease/phosphatase (EEP) superfamily protein YafD